VPFYLFGHSHQPAKVALDDQFDTFYLNSGTWSSPSYPGVAGDRSLFPFVEIEWENHKRPTATLMQWDEIKQKAVQIDEG
jgi:predicted phosphodiesterase